MAAVVKSRYVTPGASKGNAGMASLEYFCHRPDLEGQRQDRRVVTEQGRYQLERGGAATRELLRARLDQARGERLYSVVLSSGDPSLSQAETEQWARHTLEASRIQGYLIVAHAGEQRHTASPHAHVLFPAERVMGVRELRDFRLVAQRELEALQQTRHYELTRDLKASGHLDAAAHQGNRSADYPLSPDSAAPQRRSDFSLD